MSEQDQKKTTAKKAAPKRKKVISKKAETSPANTAKKTKPLDTDNINNTSTSSAVVKPMSRDWSGKLALLLVLVLASVIIIVIWQRGWWSTDNGAEQQLQTTQADQTDQLNQLQQQLQQLQNQLQQLSSQDLSATATPLIEATQQRLRNESQTALQPINSQLRTQQQSISDQQNRLRALENRLVDINTEQQQTQNIVGREQTLQEIKLLLMHARQQIALNGNTDAAIAAYQSAEQALASADLADAHELQAALISERQLIQAVQVTDINALVAELNGLQQALPLWPLQGQLPNKESSNEETTQDWRGKLRSSFGQLVQVRKTIEPIISLEQSHLLRQQLGLHLQTASLLALQRQQASFKQTVDNAKMLLEQAFDTDNRGVEAALSTLQSMLSTPLIPEWPTLDLATDQLAALERRSNNLEVID